ncbi:MAG: trypsin-like peptidase domain-containing protein [Planctomycetes bacterium]|nr:trypsin-like peptidase domain-containing protein [Planctomycetota bacterium]
MQNMPQKLSGYGPSLIVLATAMLVLFVGPSAVRKLTYESTRTQIIQASNRLEGNNVLEQINQAYRDIAMMVEPSVVHISVQHRIRGRTVAISSGSGWIFDEKGHVVTNYHVIRDAERIDVQLDAGELRVADVIGYDDTTDIAVLKIAEGRLHPAQLADPQEAVQQGDLVFAFGSPFDFRFSMSSGVISGKGRSVGVIRNQAGGNAGYENFIQVDAAINPGNSGGPLTNFRGQVIGMNTAIATGRQKPRRGERQFEEGQFAGIGLAIPLEMILPVVEQLIENGFVIKGFLGVNLLPLEGSLADNYRRKGFNGQGVVLERVIKGDPADRAGLKMGDVITHVNGRVMATIPQLRSFISSILPGQIVTIDYWRFDPKRDLGESMSTTVKLDRLDTILTDGSIPPDQPRHELRQLGINAMETSSRKLASQFNAEYRAGVMIKEIDPDSMLSRQAEAGWTIVSVNDIPVRDIDDFFEALGNFNLLSGIKLDLIDTEGNYQQATVGSVRP